MLTPFVSVIFKRVSSPHLSYVQLTRIERKTTGPDWHSTCINAPGWLRWYRGLGLEVSNSQKIANLIRDNLCPCQNTEAALPFHRSQPGAFMLVECQSGVVWRRPVRRIEFSNIRFHFPKFQRWVGVPYESRPTEEWVSWHVSVRCACLPLMSDNSMIWSWKRCSTKGKLTHSPTNMTWLISILNYYGFMSPFSVL